MSKITATVHQDPEIDDIRASVASKSDGYPYVLLPVKIETRFMKVDKPITIDNSVVPVLDDLYVAIDLLDFDPFVLPRPQLFDRLSKASTLMESLQPHSGKLQGINATDWQRLSTKVNLLEGKLNSLSTSLGKLNVKSTDTAGALRTLRTTLMGGFAKVKTNVANARPVKTETPTVVATKMLEDVTATLTSLAQAEYSTKDYKAKRKLFAFVDEKLESLEKARVQARKLMAINQTATKSQLDSLKTQLKSLQPTLARVAKGVSSIQSDYKAAEYTSKLRLAADQFGKLEEEIRGLLLPKLEMQAGVTHVDIREIFYRVREANVFLASMNRKDFKDYAEVKSSREALYKRLHAIREDAHRLIHGTERDIALLGKAWDQVDAQLETFVKRVQKLAPRTKTEKSGLARTVTHITKEYRTDLEGLKSSSRSIFPHITNQVMDKSVVAFTESLQKIGQVQALFTGGEKLTKAEIKAQGARLAASSPAEIAAAVSKLDQEFQLLSRDIQLLPGARLKELQAASSALRETALKALDTAGVDPKSETYLGVVKATQGVMDTANAQVSDVLDLRDRFYDTYRKPIAFGFKTQTVNELWVRIFPDDIAIHTHETALTQEEYDAGVAYWYEIWAAGSDEELKLAAWRAIITSYGPQRAAYIVKCLEPTDDSSTLVTDAFTSISSGILDTISTLGQANRVLDEGISRKEDVFEVLGNVYPILKVGVKQMGKVGKASDTLMRRTRGALLKTQSKLSKYFGTIQKIPKEDRAGLGGKLEVAALVQESYNQLLNDYQRIRPVKSGELIKGLPEKVVPTFPSVTIKDSSWTQTPTSKVLPDRFVVVAKRGGAVRYMEAGKPIPSGLAMGMDPDSFDSTDFQYDADGNLIVPDEIKWLTDYPTAVEKGMAISFQIEQEDVDEGFDQLFVIGVKNTSSATGKSLLEGLMDNHHYLPEGAAFMPVGTPTNNTSESKSGYSSYEEDASVSFATERDSEDGDPFTTDPDYLTDHERLASALGIGTSVLRHLQYSLGTEVSDGLNMNKALFHGTIGNHLEEGLDTLFTLDNINRAKTFFGNYVTARGYLPTLRVGTQPYGILPTSALSLFEWTNDDSQEPQLIESDYNNLPAIEDELQTRFDIRLKRLIRTINDLFTSIRTGALSPTVPAVKHAGDMEAADDPQAYFMEMLGLEATSVEYYNRYGLNVAARETTSDFSVGFKSTDPYGPDLTADAFASLLTSGIFWPSDGMGSPSLSTAKEMVRDARAFSLRFLKREETAEDSTTTEIEEPILGETVDRRELSEDVQSATASDGTPEEDLAIRGETDYYLDWLVSSNPYDVQALNQFAEVVGGSVVDGIPGKSLLLLLLRHAMLGAYADAILKILEYEGLIDQQLRKMLGQAPYYYTSLSGNMTYVTRWTFLFSRIEYLKDVLGNHMDEGNPFYVHMTTRSGSNAYLNRYVSPVSTHISQVRNTYAGHANHAHIFAELTATQEAISRLAQISTADLNRLLAEHLDICSYRMDAWYLALVNKRLSQQRASKRYGAYIGAYGWVENLRKGGVLTPATNLPSGLWKSGDGTVYTDEDNLGYIHAPSLTHAITAAILRAGFHANEATAETENQMAVNLSSARVRTALNLLNGVRGGQELGALLGYQFERGLHERYTHLGLELDEFIYDFREEFPLTGEAEDYGSDSPTTTFQVVNGLELLEFTQDFIEDNGGPADLGDSLYDTLSGDLTLQANFWAAIGSANLASATADEKDAMIREIDRMADAFDALGDLCVSESVYQVAKGNHVRASAIMDQLSKGELPQEVEIADTPRTGTVVTQKVALFFDVVPSLDWELTDAGATAVPIAGTDLDTAVTAASARPAGWSSDFTPRAILEPTLNKWVGGLIGDPSTIKCYTEYTLDEVTTGVTVTLADLGLQPLDVLHLFASGIQMGGSELNARIAVATRSTIGALPGDFVGTTDDVAITIHYTLREGSWASTDLSFYEVSSYLQSIRTLLSASGVFAADHLVIPGEEEVEEDVVRNQDLDELMVRVTNAVARLQAVSDSFDDFFTNEIDPEEASTTTFSNVQVDALRSLLTSASWFGFPSSVVELTAGYGDSVGRTLILAADGVSTAMGDRLTRAAQQMAIAEDTSKPNDPRVEALAEAARCVMGPAYRVVPQFKLRNATELADQLNLATDKGLLREAGKLDMVTWAQSMGLVRERMSTLENVDLMAENFGNDLPEMVPVQLPFAMGDGTTVPVDTAADHWLGLPYPTGYTPTEDKLSVVLMNHGAITTDASGNKAALLIDEWVEIIPNRQETTGITFNYDQPDAKAPNNILLAVTPKVTGKWDWDNLVHTLEDTLELAKNRAVEPEQLENTFLGQILPGILTEIVPPQLMPEEGTEGTGESDNPLGMQVVTDFKVNNDTYVEEETTA
jgi:hypothetical protein